MIIYELSYQGGLIRVCVYRFDSIGRSFPRSVVANLSFSPQRREVSEEQQLGTRLNTDSFNYDFHLKEISN